MQIIQSSLGNTTRSLGTISSLCDPNRLLLTKKSNFFHSSIRNQVPLVTASKFLFSHEYDPSVKRFIDWDRLEHQGNSEYPLFDFESLNSTEPEENSKSEQLAEVKTSNQNKLQAKIKNNIINERSQQVDTQEKSKSKKTKLKSKTQKKAKSSRTKKAEKLVNKIDDTVNINQDRLLADNEHLPTDNKSEIQALQGNSSLDETINNSDFVNNIPTSSIVENQSAVFKNVINDELQVIPESQSILANSELSTDINASDVTESNLPLQQKRKLGDRNLDSAANLPIEFPLPNNIEETFTPLSNFGNNQQEVITEASQAVNVSDIPFSPTSPQQNIEAYNKVLSIAPHQTTSPSKTLVEKKEVLPSLNSLPQTIEHTNFDENTASESKLITENSTRDFIVGNSVDNISDSTAQALPSVDHVSTLLVPSTNEEQPLVSNLPDALDSPEPSTGINTSDGVINPITLQPEINSDRITSEPTASNSIQLKSTSASVVNTPNLLNNFDNNEYLVYSESESNMAVNISEDVNNAHITVNTTSLTNQTNSDSIISKATENQPILAPLTTPEIAESETTGLQKKSSRKGAEAQRDEELFSNDEATANIPIATSPEILQTETTGLLNQEKKSSRRGAEAQRDTEQFSDVETTSPEIAEPEIKAIALPTTSPEIFQTETTGLFNQEKKSSRKGAKTQRDEEQFSDVEATENTFIAASSEIAEPETKAIAPSTTSLEIFQTETTASTPNTTSPNVAETPSVFRNVIVSEIPSAVTNPEISSFVETSDNPDIPANELTTSPEVEQDAITENLPAPKGYATGGQVTDSRVENHQAIAPSDTVPAMLTPGEFVINTRDAQKNLPLLHHINTGGTPQDIILPSLQTANPQEQEQKTSPETPTKVDSFPDTPLQRQGADTHSSQVSNPLIPSSLGLNLGRPNLSILNSPQLSTYENKTNDAGESSPHYSSPPMIFRKASSSTNTPTKFSETPSQWSSIEDLLNGNNEEFTNFNFSGVESNWQNPEFSDVSKSSESPQVFPKHLPAPRGFAEGGEVTPSDISTEIEPVTETIQNPSLSAEEDNTVDALETLAREIYSRLRQRVEIEQERYGSYLGRIPW